MDAQYRTKTESVKVTPEQSAVLAFLKETTKKSVSNLIYEALLEKYDFPKLHPVARSFFDKNV